MRVLILFSWLTLGVIGIDLVRTHQHLPITPLDLIGGAVFGPAIFFIGGVISVDWTKCILNCEKK